jgi:carboxypeptidase Taq
MSSSYDTYATHLRKLADIEVSIAVMSWDKEVNLPPEGARFRSQQVATLSGIHHEESTSEEFVSLVKALQEQSSTLDLVQRRNLALTWRDLQKTLKLDTEFVVRMSQAVSEGYHAWLQAREENRFEIFGEKLETLIDLKKEEAERLGYEGHPYDALLDHYEPDATVAMLDPLFADVQSQLTPFAADIRDRFQPETDFLRRFYPRDEQWEFGLDLLKKIGYRFEAGRQDLSPHPFTTSFSPQDVRVTTRLDEHDLANMTWSCIHEGGHALYEQGLPVEFYGLPSGRAVSLSIHESQSRLWENHVGRSLAFWKAEYPGLQNRFSANLKDISLEHFYRAINAVQPNLIRTEADELHYHFHIMIRYEIEKQLIEGSLAVADIPKVWSLMYKEYLNMDVPDDKQGPLQDIHWAHGGLGYFPTYSLGSFYAAQFFAQAGKDIDSLEAKISEGNYKELLDWLRENIHRHGRMYDAEDLCKKVTGEALNFSAFMAYAKGKFESLAKGEPG